MSLQLLIAGRPVFHEVSFPVQLGNLRGYLTQGHEKVHFCSGVSVLYQMPSENHSAGLPSTDFPYLETICPLHCPLDISINIPMSPQYQLRADFHNNMGGLSSVQDLESRWSSSPKAAVYVTQASRRPIQLYSHPFLLAALSPQTQTKQHPVHLHSYF